MTVVSSVSGDFVFVELILLRNRMILNRIEIFNFRGVRVLLSACFLILNKDLIKALLVLVVYCGISYLFLI